MSRAGRPSQRRLRDRLIAGAEEVLYVCRNREGVYQDPGGASVMRCEKCNGEVLVIPSVLAEKRALATSLGRDLTVVCDRCGLNQSGPVVALMPSQVDLREARRVRPAGRGGPR